jgi:hypothetical protein
MKSLSRQSLEEQTLLVSRYVAGDLSRSERAEFEAWLVASPELAAEVEMERRLRRGISSAARRGWIQRQAPLGIRERPWRMAAAAAGLCLAITLTLAVGLPRSGDDVASTQTTRARSQSSPLTVRLGSLRGAVDSPDIAMSLASRPSSLVIEPDVVVLTCADGSLQLECEGGSAPQTPQYAEYELDLVRRRGATLAWRSPRQAPMSHTQLSFTFGDPARLDAGDYDVIVRGHSSSHAEVVGRFWLRVSAQSPFDVSS